MLPVTTVSALPRFTSPEGYAPRHLAEKILTSKAALEGERKQVTVLLADLKGSMELLADCDPVEARKILDPVLERMMEAVHRYEGPVNQVMGDGPSCRTRRSAEGSTDSRRPSSSTRPGSFRISNTPSSARSRTKSRMGDCCRSAGANFHGGIVGVIETLHHERLGEQIERLAHHALRGELQEKAVSYLRQAGLKAAARSALPAARDWFEQALGTLEVLPENQATLEQAFEIRLELRPACGSGGEPGRVGGNISRVAAHESPGAGGPPRDPAGAPSPPSPE